MLPLILLLGLNTIAPLTGPEYTRLLESHRGKLVVVNIWATWCLPCREEFPDLVRLDREHRDVALVSITIDRLEDIQQAQAFLQEYEARFPTYIHSGQDFGEFQRAVDPDWPGAIPATYLYDREGERVFRRIGRVTYEELVQELERLERSPGS